MAQDITDCELGFVGALWFNPERLADAMAAGVSPDWFTDDGASLLWSATVSLYKRGEYTPPSEHTCGGFAPLAVRDEARRLSDADGERRDGAKIQSAEYIEKVVEATPPGGFDSMVRLMRNGWVERVAKKTIADTFKDFGTFADARDVLRAARSGFDAILTGAGTSACDDVSFYNLKDPPPEDENERTLLKNGYMRKGHGLFIVSTSGAGKSVFSIQMALHFAIGREFFGMKPPHALKVGIIQGEDDDEEMSDFRRNIRGGLMAEFGWTAADYDNALQNIILARNFRGKTGDRFLDELRTWQRRRRFDVVIVNPLFSYFGGNLSDSRDDTQFFRVGLDPLISDPECGFGIVFVHHATKPPKDAESKKGWGSDAFAQYIGAGGTDIAGWSRASLVLLPISGHYGWFKLVAAKRGGRLGWKDADGNNTTERIIAYGKDGGIYWRAPVEAEIPDDIRKGAAKIARGGEISEADATARIIAHVRSFGEIGITKTKLREWCSAQFGGMTNTPETPQMVAFRSIANAPWKFGLEIRKDGRKDYLRLSNTFPEIVAAEYDDGEGDADA